MVNMGNQSRVHGNTSVGYHLPLGPDLKHQVKWHAELTSSEFLILLILQSKCRPKLAPSLKLCFHSLSGHELIRPNGVKHLCYRALSPVAG